MDSAGLAAAVTALLAPHIARTGQKLPDPAGMLWRAVAEKFAGRPAAEEAAKDLLAAPLDADTQAAFRKELKKALDDADFARQLLVCFSQAAHGGPGEQNIAGTIVNVENSFGTIQFGASNVQNIDTQINDSTIGGDVIDGDKNITGQ
jgi:hypothetical protein